MKKRVVKSKMIRSDCLQVDCDACGESVSPLDNNAKNNGIQIGDEIFISQVKEMFDGEIYEDHNLKISNIKESIDFESRNFKISNVSITLSNYADLSDKLSSIVLMNLPVYIYWKTQSCTTIDDCLKVYQANIRRFDHDEKRISIKLEDSTQEKFKKEVPLANLGETTFAYSDKYVNRYIPMTFGRHDYAPAVIWRPNEDELNFQVICDDVHNILDKGNRNDIYTWIDGDSLTPLRAYKGVYVDIYNTVQFPIEFVNPGDFDRQDCYSAKDGDGNMLPYVDCFLHFDAGRPQNPFANDEFQGEFKRYPVGLEFIDSDGQPFDGETYAGNTFEWAGSVDSNSPEITISNPKASYDKYGNIFNRFSSKTYAQVPDVDESLGDVINDAEAVAIQNDFDDWKEELAE